MNQSWDPLQVVGTFANSPGDRGSMPDRVILKTTKWYLMLPCLTQYYKVGIKGKRAIQGKKQHPCCCSN